MPPFAAAAAVSSVNADHSAAAGIVRHAVAISNLGMDGGTAPAGHVFICDRLFRGLEITPWPLASLLGCPVGVEPTAAPTDSATRSAAATAATQAATIPASSLSPVLSHKGDRIIHELVRIHVGNAHSFSNCLEGLST